MPIKRAHPDLPISLYVGFLSHINKRDATARVQGLIRRQIVAPEVAYWYLRKCDDGYAYEVQEGGRGRAYLPGILDALDRDPDASIVLRTSTRAVRVSRADGLLASVVLPEDVEPEFSDLGPTARMQVFAPTGFGALTTAGVFFAFATVAWLVASLTVSHADEQYREIQGTGIIADINSLPTSHWPKNISPDTYVAKVQFSGDHWTPPTMVKVSTPTLPPGLPKALEAAVEAHARAKTEDSAPGAPVAPTPSGASR